MTDGLVLSLCDYSANMVRPWAKAGYETMVVDTKHEGNERTESIGDGEIQYVAADVTDWLPPRREYAFVAGFPPCDALAVSGARWFKQKGLGTLDSAIDRVVSVREIAKWADPKDGWMIENPVSTLSSYWREPDYTFHPYEYTGYTSRDEAYTKKTCLWTDERDRFLMPEPNGITKEEADDRIHTMPPSDDRSEKRAQTPIGFAQAVFQANASIHIETDTEPVSQEQ